MSKTSTREIPELSVGLFLKRFARHKLRVASFVPSSRQLSHAACRHVRSDLPQTIVELGAGTGPITQAAAAKMHPDSRLIAIEIDRTFARILARRVPRANVLRCDARELPARLAELGIDKVDLLLNGLPTPSLPMSINEVVFDCFARFAPAAIFSQITVMPWIYLPLYRRLFQEVKFDLVAANFPPGGVYHCRTLRDDYAGHLPGRKKAVRRAKLLAAAAQG